MAEDKNTGVLYVDGDNPLGVVHNFELQVAEVKRLMEVSVPSTDAELQAMAKRLGGVVASTGPDHVLFEIPAHRAVRGVVGPATFLSEDALRELKEKFDRAYAELSADWRQEPVADKNLGRWGTKDRGLSPKKQTKRRAARKRQKAARRKQWGRR